MFLFVGVQNDLWNCGNKILYEFNLRRDKQAGAPRKTWLPSKSRTTGLQAVQFNLKFFTLKIHFLKKLH